ncbi:nitroreductase family protein [Methanobacterium petrolearium]|uniref:nitroreductase family protein n=1 Tax=Methanobacterium petrolearium TaxID=710190 RepID=UPI001AE6495D|nr:nitroreductase family protein [Methanobacterium petrolearium]MBP1946772.1 nitroreductase [Methanobacterium petrolearium]BDZ69742.1 nitroreductase [Methanobacterium petrolearium]
MEFKDLIQERYSVRNYQSRPVEDEKLEAVLEAARLAPTAANKQPFRLIVVKTQGKKDQMKRIYHGDWFSEAPLVICACSVKSESWTRRDGRNYVDVDVTIAMDHLIMQAADLGLGTCWIAAFDAEAAKEILKIPENVEPLLFTPLGYPADELGPKSRKELDELVHYEEW